MIRVGHAAWVDPWEVVGVVWDSEGKFSHEAPLVILRGGGQVSADLFEAEPEMAPTKEDRVTPFDGTIPAGTMRPKPLTKEQKADAVQYLLTEINRAKEAKP